MKLNDAESGTQQVKESDRDNKNDAESGTQQVKGSDRDNKKVIFSQKDESSSDEDTLEEKGSQTLFSNAEEKKSQALSSSVDDTSDVCPVNCKNKEEKQTDNELHHAETDTSSDTTENHANEREQYGAEHLKHSDTKPKINTVVQYCLNDGSITKAKVISTQAKRSGKYKECINVHIMGKEEPNSVDWREVLWWREAERVENVLGLSTVDEYNQEIIDVKEKEFQNLVDNDVLSWFMMRFRKLSQPNGSFMKK